MVETGTVQLVVPLAVLAAASTVAVTARLVHRRRPGSRDMAGLGPGVILFTSQRCPGCDPARDRLVEVLGAKGFREIKWTEQPEPFGTYRIHRVPTTAAVDADGRGSVWEGVPPTRLLRKWKYLVPRP